jgi:hypothetical protein
MSKIEREAVKGVKKNVVKDLSCPYECSNGCSIYNDRPIICRLFGTVNGALVCPHGYMSEDILSLAQVDEIMRVYEKELMR